MKIIDRISALKIKDIGMSDLKAWIEEEIYDCADDFGYSIDGTQAAHIAKRMYEILVNKYRFYEPGFVHSVIQRGIAGDYGKATKVTLSVLLHWITTADKANRGENIDGLNDIWKEKVYSEAENQRFWDIADRCIPFIKHCLDKMIDVSELTREQYDNLRDRFNRKDDTIYRDLERLPKFQTYGIADMIRI